MKKIILATLLVFVPLFSKSTVNKADENSQAIVVVSKKWSSPSGMLQRYEKKEGDWEKVGTPMEIKLGRNGLGWGIGLHTIPRDAKSIKKEGDGKAPAGIFELKQAFGYHPFVTDYPYEVYRTTDHCVDDAGSKFYNKIVDSKRIKKDYQSFEHMKFKKNYYKYGIAVNHNHLDESGAKKGAGSCIFIHIKSIPTAGCTVVKKESQMETLIEWLKAESNPLLIQGTTDTVKQLLKERRILTSPVLISK